MLGGGFLNSRLATRIRQKDGLSYGVGSGLQRQLARPERPLHGDGDLRAAERRASSRRRSRKRSTRMLKDGFTDEEVEAAKTGWLQSRQVSRAQDNELAGRLNTYLFLDRTLQWDAELEAQDQGADAGADQRRHAPPHEPRQDFDHQGRRLQEVKERVNSQPPTPNSNDSKFGSWVLGVGN